MDTTQASTLLQGFEKANVIADKAYDSNALIDQIQQQKCIPVIPPRYNRKILRSYDECFFNKIKHFRRIFSRFDKKASSFFGFLAYASIILWLR